MGLEWGGREEEIVELRRKENEEKGGDIRGEKREWDGRKGDIKIYWKWKEKMEESGRHSDWGERLEKDGDGRRGRVEARMEDIKEKKEYMIEGRLTGWELNKEEGRIVHTYTWRSAVGTESFMKEISKEHGWKKGRGGRVDGEEIGRALSLWEVRMKEDVNAKGQILHLLPLLQPLCAYIEFLK